MALVAVALQSLPRDFQLWLADAEMSLGVSVAKHFTGRRIEL